MKSDEKSLKGMTLWIIMWISALFGMSLSVNNYYHRFKKPYRRRSGKRPSLSYSHNLLIWIRQAVTNCFIKLSKHQGWVVSLTNLLSVLFIDTIRTHLKKTGIIIPILLLFFAVIPLKTEAGIWTSVGPDGTYSRAIVVSPNYASDQTLFVGGGARGVYKSENGGASWVVFNTGPLGTNVYALAISPNYTTDQTLFAGIVGGLGSVIKSVDGGASWTSVSTGLSTLNVYSFAISPGYAADQTLFAGTSGGGVFKSVNGGASWTAVSTGLSNLNVYSFAISPSYATDQTLFAGTSGGAFKSVNGGASWTAVNTGLSNLYVYSFAISPEYPCDGVLFAGISGSSAWKYTDTEAIAICNSPVLDLIGSKSVNEGSMLSFVVSGSDPDGDALIFSASGLPTGASFNPVTRTFSWTPDYTQTGLYSVTFMVSDGSLTDSEVVAITVNNVNRAPVLNPIGNRSVAEGATLNVGVSASDADGTIPSLSATSLPAFCSFIDNLNGTGTLTCAPGQTAAGMYPGITVTASDGSLTDSETITLTVTAVNLAPILSAIGANNVNEGSNLNFTVSGSDPDGDAITFSATGLPVGATFNTSTRVFDWTPTYSQSGSYNVTFTVSDGSLSASEVVTITVNNVNRAPVLNPIGNQTVAEGGTLNVSVAASGPDGNTLTITASGLPSFCGFTDNLNNTGTLTCTPGFNDSGLYTGLTITASDGFLADSETFSLTVTGLNRAPVVASIADQSVNEGATLNLPVTASDPDGSAVTLTASGLPGFCSFTDNLNNTGTVTCTPGFNDGGVYIGLTVTASDGALTGSDSFNLTVNGVNRAPVVAPIADQSVSEGGTLNLPVSASDLDGDSLTLSVTGLPAFCSFTDNLNNTGSLTCTPGFADAGVYSGITVTANDGNGGTGSDSFNLTVTGVNRAPILNPIGAKGVNEGSLLSFTVSGSDPDGDSLTFSVTGMPVGASFNPVSRMFSWTPDYTQAGLYNVTFSVTDGSLTDSEVVSITVNNVNAPPVLAPIGAQTAFEGGTLNVTVTASDPDGDSLALTATGLPGFCSFTDNLNNTGILTCNPGFTDAGVYPGITVSAGDGSVTDSETFALTVSGVNAAPILDPIGNKNVDEGATLNVTITASDPDGDSLNFAATGLPGFCGFTDNLDNTATLTCSPGFANAGVYTGLTVTVTDGIAGDSEGFTLTVNNVNRPPTLNPIGNQAVDEGNTLNVTVTSYDPDGGLLTFGATGLPAFCGFTDNLNNTGALVCSPGYADAGVYTGLTIIVNDGTLTDSETLSLTVNNVIPSTEVCDGIDNDLDGQIDEGFPDTDGDGQADCVDTDDDNDGYSDATEIAAGSDPLNAASIPEVCDGIDNDLDSLIDEDFPTGNTSCGSNVNVTPDGVTFTFPSVTLSGDTTVTTSGTGTPPPSGFKLGATPTYYEITTTATFSGPVEVCINYEETQFRTERSLKLFHWNGSGWDNITTSMDTTGNVICGLTTSFSPFIVAEELSTAVTLQNISAHLEGEQVVISWSTSFEIDNEGFIILRAESLGGPFTPITQGMIPAMGGGFKATYTFTDGNVEQGKTYYYRLQDVDSRGRVTAHQVIPVTVAEAKASGESQENVSKEDNTTSASQQTDATTGVVALHTLPNPGPSSFLVSIEDDKGNVILVSRVEDTESTSTLTSDLMVTYESDRLVLTWQGKGKVKGFILHRAEKGKDNYTSITSLIPYFGRDDKDIFLYRFTDKGVKPGVKYDYRLEIVDTDQKGGITIGKLAE